MTVTSSTEPDRDVAHAENPEAVSHQVKPELHLMRVTIERLEQNRTPGGNRPWAGFLAAVRTGLTPSGDLHAQTVTGPFTAQLPPDRAAAARRAAAIRATNKDVPNIKRDEGRYGRPIGASLADLYCSQNNGKRPGQNRNASGSAVNDQIIDQVNALPLLDTDNAALLLHNLIGRCASTPVDFLDVARTLVFWGDGISPRSVATRQKVIADFYGVRA